MQQPADLRFQTPPQTIHPSQLCFFSDLLCCSFFSARRRQNVMEKVFRRLQFSQPPNHHHAFQRLSQHRPTDLAAPAMLVKGRSRAGGQGVIKRVRQQGLKLAACHPVFCFVIHCLPAFYYVKVIALVPFFLCLFATSPFPPAPAKPGQSLCSPYPVSPLESLLPAGLD